MTKNDVLNLLFGLGSIIGGVVALSSIANPYKDSIIYIIVLVCSVLFAAFSAFFSIYLSSKNKRKDRIFISYSVKDMSKVVKIANKIKEFGYKPWIGIDEILPGQNIFDEIKRAIENSSVFLVILSENYNSVFVTKELELAMSIMRSNDKTFTPVLPVIIDDTPIASIPEALKSIQWLDLRKNEKGYRRLKDTLDRIFNKDS